MKPWELTLKYPPPINPHSIRNEGKLCFHFPCLRISREQKSLDVWCVMWHSNGIHLILQLRILLSHWENRDTFKATGNNTQSSKVKVFQSWSTRSHVASEHKGMDFWQGSPTQERVQSWELVTLLLRTCSFERNSAEKWESSWCHGTSVFWIVCEKKTQEGWGFSVTMTTWRDPGWQRKLWSWQSLASWF